MHDDTLTKTPRRGFSRKKRIAWQVLAPAPLGVAVMVFPSAFWNAFFRADAPQVDWLQVGLVFVIYAFAAYIIAGIPSVIFAVLMEWAFALGLAPNSWVAVVLAGALGALAGVTMIAVPSGFVIPAGQIGIVAMFGTAGCCVGLIIGVVTKWKSRSVTLRATASS